MSPAGTTQREVIAVADGSRVSADRCGLWFIVVCAVAGPSIVPKLEDAVDDAAAMAAATATSAPEIDEAIEDALMSWRTDRGAAELHRDLLDTLDEIRLRFPGERHG
ncbi:MAG TPA: hypothetical protein VGG74_06645 [Kofleriaceae bacterium]|jgi:hypothetical protein